MSLIGGSLRLMMAAVIFFTLDSTMLFIIEFLITELFELLILFLKKMEGLNMKDKITITLKHYFMQFNLLITSKIKHAVTHFKNHHPYRQSLLMSL